MLHFWHYIFSTVEPPYPYALAQLGLALYFAVCKSPVWVRKCICGLHNKGVDVSFLWVPAHMGVEGNEEADILAKQELKSNTINIEIPSSKEEIKSIISKRVQNLIVWQDRYFFGGNDIFWEGRSSSLFTDFFLWSMAVEAFALVWI